MPMTRSRGKPGDLFGHPAHDVQGIRYHNNDGLGTVLLDLLGDLFDDVGVGADEVVAAHPRLACDARRDDHEVRSRRRTVVIRSDDPRIEAFDRRRLGLIERFALRDAFDDIDQDDGTGEFFFGEALCGGGAGHSPPRRR